MKKYIKEGFSLITTIVIACLAIPAIAILGFMFRYLLLALIPIAIGIYILSPKFRRAFSLGPLNKLVLNGFQVPMSVFLYPKHSWAKVESKGRVAIGIDDFMQRVLGPIEKIEMPRLGDKIEIGDNILQLKHGERTVAVKSPIKGIVCAINKKLTRDPKLINRAPYSEGWIVKVNPVNLSEGIKNLKVANGAIEWFRHEMDRFRAIVSSHGLLAEVLQDGGTLVDDLSAHIDYNTWLQIKSNFFNNSDKYTNSVLCGKS